MKNEKLPLGTFEWNCITISEDIYQTFSYIKKRIKMKFYFSIILCLSFVLIIQTKLEAQQTLDSTLIDSYKEQLSQLQKYQTSWLDQKTAFEEISRGFCLLNQEEPEKANELLELSLKPSFLPNETKYKFLRGNFRCLKKEQLHDAKVFLNNNLLYSQPYYHELVSLYNIRSQIKTLSSHIPDKNILDVIKEQLKKGGIKDSTLQQLRNMAALANLGQESYEDKILETIAELKSLNELEESYATSKAFSEVLINTIPYLYSKRSVIETLYLLEQESIKPIDDQDDITGTDPAFSYFQSCVLPKIKFSEIEILAWTDFEKNKAKIKDYILNDNSIWLEHIRIE